MIKAVSKESCRTIITPAQLRGARAMLDWSRKELRAVTGISVETIKNIECGKFVPQAATVSTIIQCFSVHGVQFIGQLGMLMLPKNGGQP